jgi:hypothetical protein
MWLLILIPALIGVCALLCHILLELNALEKSVAVLDERVREHYEHRRASQPDQSVSA